MSDTARNLPAHPPQPSPQPSAPPPPVQSRTASATTPGGAHRVVSTAFARRRLFQAGAFALLGAALPWAREHDRAAAAAGAANGGFGFGVASGDPLADAVIIWTRFSPRTSDGRAVPGSGQGAPTTVRWTVSASPDCTTAVASGEVTTSADTDHTVTVDVTGLEPYTEYYYFFSADGEVSEVGRTRTAPDEPGRTHALRLAQVSCSNYTGGHFGTYRALAERDDLDFVLHLGDYFYEYGNGDDRYGPAELAGERDHEPAHETVTLEDYRLRLAQYRADPDARAVHARHPFITVFDDHEIADNAWADGAVNHNEGEGDFRQRQAAAFRAYAEWLPIRMPDSSASGTRFHRRFTFGELADLSVVETRQHRSEQVGSFVLIADAGTREKLDDPDRHIMEPAQMEWVRDGVRSPRRWHLIGNQVMVASLAWPGEYSGFPRGSVMVNADAWDGYRADQQQLLRHMAHAPADAGDTVILTGDIHSSWVGDLVAEPEADLDRAVADYPEAADAAAAAHPAPKAASAYAAPGVRDGSPIPPMIAAPVPQPQLPAQHRALTPAGVEFVCPSITSDGFYEIVRRVLRSPKLAVGAVELAASVLRSLNPGLKWMDGIGHGYVLIDVTPERVQADYYLTPVPSESAPDPRLEPGHRPRYHTSWQTTAGSRTAQPASGPVGARSDEPRTAECTAPTTGPTPSHPAPTHSSPAPTPEASASPDPSPTAAPTSTDSAAPTAESSPQQQPSSAPSPGPSQHPAPQAAELPMTGGVSGGLLGVGAAAVAGGIGLRLASRGRRRTADDADDSPETEAGPGAG